MPAKCTDDATDAAIVAAHEQGDNLSALSRRFGCSRTTVRRVLVRHGITLPDDWHVHDVDTEFFAAIDTEEKAYWLGFIAADGCVTSNGQKGFRFTMNLAERDAAHLERFRAAVGYTGPLARRVKKSPRSERMCAAVSIQVGRDQFCQHLIRHGVTPRKSWGLVPPTANVPDDLLRHYWRGHFEGDGWFGVPGESAKKRQWQMGLCGTRAVAEAFAEFARSRAAVTAHAAHAGRGGQTWYATVRGVHQIQAVAGLLYDLATVSLDRKKAIADRILAEKPKHRSPVLRPPVTIGGVTLSIHRWAERLGLNPTTVYNRISQGEPPEAALRPADRHRLTCRGETLTLAEWSRRTGIGYTTLKYRLRKGLPADDVLRPPA